PDPIQAFSSVPARRSPDLPLVAFDARGNRLGMGGGFYDRTFARAPRARTLRPRLVGLAHHFQQVASLPAEPWDIPLDAIATDATDRKSTRLNSSHVKSSYA